MVVPLFSSLFQPQPWVVIGDYNAVSSAVEKFSIHPINSPATSEFNNMMASSSLQDIGLAGSNLPAQIRGKVGPMLLSGLTVPSTIKLGPSPSLMAFSSTLSG